MQIGTCLWIPYYTKVSKQIEGSFIRITVSSVGRSSFNKSFPRQARCTNSTALLVMRAIRALS